MEIENRLKAVNWVNADMNSDMLSVAFLSNMISLDWQFALPDVRMPNSIIDNKARNETDEKLAKKDR